MKYIVYNYLINPLKTGIIGFSLFFTIILFVKMINVVFFKGSFLLIEKEDIFLSLLGFGIAFVLTIANNLSRKKDFSPLND